MAITAKCSPCRLKIKIGRAKPRRAEGHALGSMGTTPPSRPVSRRRRGTWDRWDGRLESREFCDEVIERSAASGKTPTATNPVIPPFVAGAGGCLVHQ